jgi:hypothetical protein
MSERPKKKFSLGDIIRKINEEKLADAAHHQAEPTTEGTLNPPQGSSTPTRADHHLTPPTPEAQRFPVQSPPSSPRQEMPPVPSHVPGGSVPSPHRQEHQGHSPSSDNDGDADFDILRYITVIFRRKNIILVCGCIALCFAVVNYIRAVKYYTAKTHMLFSPGYQDIIGDEQGMFIS